MPNEIVDLLFIDPTHQTKVWISERVAARIVRWKKKEPQKASAYFEDIEYYAEVGFGLYVGNKRPIRPKRGGVFGTDPGGTLFRLYGFPLNGWSEFIVLGSTLKHGQRMDGDDWDEVNYVVSMKDAGWERRVRNE